MIVTAKLLHDRGACPVAVERFERLFPAGARVTVATCVQHAKDWDWDWATVNLIPSSTYELRRVFLRLTQVERHRYHASYSAVDHKTWQEAQARAFARLVRYPALRVTDEASP